MTGETQDLCLCGSGKAYGACCGPIIAGEPAMTAEALMRSRYTAYARGDIDHVFGSHDPATRGEIDREETEKWSKENRWTGLDVLHTEKGSEQDDTGVVEFVA